MKDDIITDSKERTVNNTSGNNNPKGEIKKPSASSVHASTQRSQTLYRRAVKKPTVRGKILTRNNNRSIDITPRSNKVEHFAKQPTASPVKPAAREVTKHNIQPKAHPIAAKAHKIQAAKIQAKKPAVAKSAKTIKEEAIAEALSKPTIKHKKKSIFKRHPKIFNAFTFGAIFIVIVGYFTYLSMPSISVRIANAQAGINATFPEYQPDGYSLSGPITYSDSEITIKFHSNTGNGKFEIKQSKSSWDSSAVKNKVDKDSKGQFITTEEKGLTIYTYDGNAAWVNGGILYSISGNAPLSSDQIRRIATSL